MKAYWPSAAALIEKLCRKGWMRLIMPSILVKSTRPLAREASGLPFGRAAQPVDALAEGDVALGGGAGGVGDVEVGLEAQAAQPVVAVRCGEDVAFVVGQEGSPESVRFLSRLRMTG